MASIKVRLKPRQGIKVKDSNKYIWDPDIAQEFIDLTEEYKNEAETSATNAKTSETNAKTSETNAKTSETNAKNSEINASVSQINAGTSEINAKSYATNAETSANEVKGYLDTVKADAESAKQSATNAKNSETNAKTSETNAKTSETTTQGYVTQAMNYADDAMDYASQAETSANASEESKDASVSAKNEATAQATIAVNASNNAVSQANIATSKAGEAETYANNAKSYMESASTSASNASTSETNAKSSEDNAEYYKDRCEEILERLGTAIKIKGRVDKLEDLPTSGNLDGDAYLVGEEGLDSYPEYYWYLNHWEFLGTSGGGGTWGTITGTLSNQTDLQTALSGKYDASNPNGYISGITSSDVTTALGYTPYNATNPNGYITSSYHDSTKQDVISDLTTIRSNATNGQSAYTTISGYGNIVTHNTSEFQDTLVSGTNIKTINSESILGSGDITIKSAPDLDNKSITKNSSDALQTVAVIDNNSNAIKTWTGTLAEYNAITTKDDNTLYHITDDNDVTMDLLKTIYPVGSLYLTVNDTCPLASLFGTWTKVSEDRVLQGAGSRGSVGSTLSESLPNIKGDGGDPSTMTNAEERGTLSGAFYAKTSSSSSYGNTIDYGNNRWALMFDASKSSSVYQDNAPVQQNAYLINIFQRTA